MRAALASAMRESGGVDYLKLPANEKFFSKPGQFVLRRISPS